MTVHEMKQRQELETPLLLFECRLRDGSVERWSTHTVVHDGQVYEGRVVRHNAFELKLGADDGIDTSSRMSVTLANTDSRMSQVERSLGWKSAKLTVRFVFYNLRDQVAATEPVAVFLGSTNPPEETNESTMRLSFVSRLSLQRVKLPSLRIQPRCPWHFPSTPEQRMEAVDGGDSGPYSRVYGCGYSADQPGGCGTLNGGQAYTSCDYTKQDCEARGMYSTDSSGRSTARFGGFQFLPASVMVRTSGERDFHTSVISDGRARANDAVPLVYGTAWYRPSVVFTRNDGNLTHCEILLGAGMMEAVHKVVVEGIEVPLGITGRDMTGTGWYNIVSLGERNGSFNLHFRDGQGRPLGDPHGGMAVLAVAVPNRVHDGADIPRVEVLADGVKLERYDEAGEPLGKAFSNNPAWVLLDVLRRSGWTTDEIAIESFARAAAWCDELIDAVDTHGQPIQTPRFQCNLVISQRKSAAEIVRGIRAASALMLTFNGDGRVSVSIEGTLEQQQGSKPPASNSSEPLNGGWPAYEFGDGTNATTGILRGPAGETLLRMWSRPGSESANRLGVEFQNAFNEYQQDGVSLADLDDVRESGQELSAQFPGLGFPHVDQALRVLRFQLQKALRGNTFVEFATSVHALGLRPGDLITLTYLREGFDRTVFRVLKLTPGENYQTVRITAQLHDDAWYTLLGGGELDGTERGRHSGRWGTLPRPLAGRRFNELGEQEFEIEETMIPLTDGTASVELKILFAPPAAPESSAAGVPLVGLSPKIKTAGGALAGGQTCYYAVSAVDSDGHESALSFLVRATIPSTTDTNCVTLQGISWAPGTSALRVYRGESPTELLRITEGVPPAHEFTDAGYAAELMPPPDPNYDHANFHWRMELMPEVEASLQGPSMVGNANLAMLPNEFKGSVVRVTGGKGEGQERVVASNDATTFALTSPWTVALDASSRFCVAEPSWRFGGSTRSDEIRFEVPNRHDTVVQISGRAANARDVETAAEMSILHRHRIGGGSALWDTAAPTEPVFGLSSNGKGRVELLGIGFTELKNTRTITAGTLTLHYWNELEGLTQTTLAAPAAATDDWIALDGPSQAMDNDIIQLGMELLRVLENNSTGSYRVERGVFDSPMLDHEAGAKVWHLSRHIAIAPFPRNFFGSPASGAYVFVIPLLNARVAGAEFFVTNQHGDSPTARAAYSYFMDEGLRTLAGGQYTLQLAGTPAIENNVTPPLIVESTRSVGDVFASLSEAPVNGSVVLRVHMGGAPYCELEVPAGLRTSPSVSGALLPPLQEGAALSMDVVGVPQAPGSHPGRNLTVTLRL